MTGKIIGLCIHNSGPELSTSHLQLALSAATASAPSDAAASAVVAAGVVVGLGWKSLDLLAAICHAGIEALPAALPKGVVEVGLDILLVVGTDEEEYDACAVAYGGILGAPLVVTGVGSDVPGVFGVFELDGSKEARGADCGVEKEVLAPPIRLLSSNFRLASSVLSSFNCFSLPSLT